MKVLFLLFLLICSHSWAQEASHPTQSILELTTKADLQCIDLKFLGICPKPEREFLPFGIKVRYWQPEVFVETVKSPGDFVIAEYGSILKPIGQKIAKAELELATGVKPLTITSGSSFNGLSTTNLQFNEAHIYDFPLVQILDVALCSDAPNRTLGVRYLSELDSVFWRRGDIEKDLPQSLLAGRVGGQCHNLGLGATPAQCMKSWGPLYPREGFVITPSQPVASAVNVVRSVSIAGSSLPTHIVESKLDFEPNIPIDKVQMVYPVKTQCFPIGKNPSEWEHHKISKEGNYVWIYWHQRECCI